MSGLQSYLKGANAEDRIARHYVDQNYCLIATRWRGQAGELDLITKKDGQFVFIEVKSSKSHAKAALSLSVAQRERQMIAAQEFLGTQNLSLDTDMRFDVALVDAAGRFDILHNAFGEF